ncbi:ABC transporter transmembrane domain-containing protein [Caldibacillus debilis]|uniref:ABC transporter transmembrane domain-containing protein n=1 Tax=Caldibacillus debilis TaxID=301148 RepID=UPI000378B74B|nr:ABC transporter transmembrane domain-containing protein [Caldibacillus debilis]
MRIFIDLGWFFRQEKKSYLIGVTLLLVIAVLQLVPPKILGYAADAVASRTIGPKTLAFYIGTLILCGGIMYVLRYYWRIYIFGSSLKLARQLRSRLYAHLTKMSPSFYQRKRIGDLMAHATNDIQAIQMTAGAGVLTLVDSLATGGFVVAAMALTISWKLTAIALIPIPLLAVLTSWYGKKLHERFDKAQAAFSELNDKTQESISGIKVTKAFGQEREEVASFSELSGDVVKKNIAVARIDALYDPTITAVIGVSFFLSVAFGAKFVVDGEMTIGQLISFTTYLGMLIWPMLALGWFFNIVERGSASYARVSRLLEEDIEIRDREGGHEIERKDLSFHIRSFAYPNNPERIVLEDIRFRLEEGQTLGIAGRTGSGKTALLRLLIRDFEGYDGEILLGGKRIQDYPLEAYRSLFGYVPQDHFLFSASILENIAFAKPDATMEEVERAAKLACIHEEILSFPEGYQTLVGERGVSLSGGQKQRISIARALLLNPEILILDDCLSAVDAKTEEAILQSLKEIRKGKTTIISSHRISAIRHADLILVLEGGKIVERGTHGALMAENGRYKKMYMQQQLETLVEKGG